MKHERVPDGKRRTVELKLDEDHLARAESLGLDIERACNRALVDAVWRGEHADRWQEENREALESWGRWVEEHGLPLEKYRLF
jgi:antitoxin CcdA